MDNFYMNNSQVMDFNYHVSQCDVDLVPKQDHGSGSRHSGVYVLEQSCVAQMAAASADFAVTADMDTLNFFIQAQMVNTISDFSTSSNSATADVTCELDSLHLARVLCFGYGYNTYFGDMSEVSHDKFFQIYANENGYALIDDFLSNINEHKEKFSCVIAEFIQNENFHSFGSSLLKRKGNFPGDDDFYDITCMDILCCNFARRVYELRPKCVDLLKNNFVPLVIKTITESEVVYANGVKSILTNKDMEKLFLYVITTLERMIILEMMNYWNDFCRDEKLKQLIYEACQIFRINYNDPICRANCCVEPESPVVDFPAAFSTDMVVPISFMALTKLNLMIEDYFKNYFSLLKPIIRDELTRIAQYSYDGYVENFEDFRKVDLQVIIRVEFYRMIESDRKYISDFLSELLLWDDKDREVELSKLFKEISDKIFELVVKSANSFCRDNIKSYRDQIRKSLSRKVCSKFGYYMGDMWGIKLHPKFDYNLSSIKRLFACSNRSIISKLCCDLASQGFNGFPWRNVSKVLFPAIERATAKNSKEEYDKLYKLLLEVPVISDKNLKRLTKYQISDLMNKITNTIRSDLRSFSRSLWREVSKMKVADAASASTASLGVSSLLKKARGRKKLSVNIDDK